MEQAPKVSIIVPVYNVEPYLRQCMDSLVNQTYQNIEIICVDDGSTDASGAILEEYAAEDCRIRLVHQSNSGLSAARNAGFLLATGSYIMYVDSDDWIDLETCQIAASLAIEHDADVVFWPYIREFEKTQSKKTMFYEDSIVFNREEFATRIYMTIAGLHGEYLKHPENADTLVTAWGKLYKKSLILENDAAFINTKEIGTEDALFNLSVLKTVNCGVYIKKYFNHYRKNNAASLTSTYKPNLRTQWKKLFKYMHTILASSERRDALLGALNNRISLSIIGLGLNALALPNKEALSEIHSILSDEEYRAAIKTLPMRYFPLHWWVFFACCKLNLAGGVFLLLKCMERMKG